MYPRILSLIGILLASTTHAADAPKPFHESELIKFQAQANHIRTVNLPEVEKAALRCTSYEDEIKAKLFPKTQDGKGVLENDSARLAACIKIIGGEANSQSDINLCGYGPAKIKEAEKKKIKLPDLSGDNPVGLAQNSVGEIGTNLKAILVELENPDTLTQLRWAITLCGAPLNPSAGKVIDRAFANFKALIKIQGGIETYLSTYPVSNLNEIKVTGNSCKTCPDIK